MKIILGACLAVALFAETAHAQQPPSSSPQPPMAAADDQHGGDKMPLPGDRETGDWDRQDGDAVHAPRHHRLPAPSKAARFRIEAGDISIGMKCPDDEPLKACEDFTLQMLDKLGSLSKH